MRAYILVGEASHKEKFLDNYARENNIPGFNIFKFENAFGIPEAREIKKNLAVSPQSGKKRVFVISANPTAEAQNALLKTLEELDDDTGFIFSNTAELLPTIISRCTVVKEEQVSQRDFSNEELEIVEKLVSEENIAGRFLALESFFAEKREEPFADLILSLRKLLLNTISNNDDHKAAECYKLIKAFVKYNALVVSNNLSPKATAERIEIENMTI